MEDKIKHVFHVPVVRQMALCNVPLRNGHRSQNFAEEPMLFFMAKITKIVPIKWLIVFGETFCYFIQGLKVSSFIKCTRKSMVVHIGFKNFLIAFCWVLDEALCKFDISVKCIFRNISQYLNILNFFVCGKFQIHILCFLAIISLGPHYIENCVLIYTTGMMVLLLDRFVPETIRNPAAYLFVMYSFWLYIYVIRIPVLTS